MPLPPFVISATIVVCERVLIEKDEVISAIRIVDIFYLSAPPPEIKPGDPLPSNLPIVSFWAVGNVKAEPAYREPHSLEVRIVNTIGEVTTIGAPITQAFDARLEPAPTASGLIAQINLGVTRFGTCYVCLYLDNEEVARSPITLALKPTTGSTD
jgi:hypothetical protein